MLARTIHVSTSRAIFGSERGSRLRAALLSSTLIVAFPAAGPADPLPTGGTVASGSASITTPGPGSMVIHQESDRAVVNWNRFSIGLGAAVDIHQPGPGSAILNRVTGDATSHIHGSLTATGQVYIVNPNGILIGRKGRIETGGGFVASTLDISDADFRAGRLTYRGQGASAAVENQGVITVGRGGYAALIGGRVDNSGTISAPLGRIGFAAGERVTLDLSGDGFLQVALPSGDDGDAEALIRNSGTVSADGGRIEMQAATARDAARNAINLTGMAEARSVSVQGGAIVLGGGPGGTVRVSGTVSAAAPRPARLVLDHSARPPRSAGGQIEITGTQVALEGATLDASGEGGGGLIRIGGDFAGAGALPRADFVTADAGTRILADALTRGDGGRVVLWSDQHTDFSGNISARGGPQGGDGGFVEVSSAGRLAYTGLTDLRAPAGAWGRLLLDPTDIFVPDTISVDAIEAQLARGDLTLDTTSADDHAGDIGITEGITWATGTTFELLADRNISIFGAISGENGGFTLNAADNITIGADVTVSRLTMGADSIVVSGGNITETGSGGAVDANQFFMLGGSWTQRGPALSGFDVADFRLDDVSANFLRIAGGDGTPSTPYLLADVYGLQGMASYANRDAHFALAGDIDASGTSGWNDDGFGAGGFDPIGNSAVAFSGSLDGRGNTIAGLYSGQNTLDRNSEEDSALFGATEGAGIRDLTLTGLDITGLRNAAGVVAFATDTVLENVHAKGNVVIAGFSDYPAKTVGGLVGEMAGGRVSGSSFEGTVQDSSTSSYPYGLVSAVGGIVGSVSGDAMLDAVSSSGEVIADGMGTARVGGIAGVSASGTEITNATSTADIRGDLTGGDSSSGGYLIAGGLVGENGGRISFSQASGAVESRTESGRPVDDSSEIGGLVGYNFGEITESSATGAVTVNTRSVISTANVSAGGLVGVNSFGSISRSFATGDVSVVSSDSVEVGGFVGRNMGIISDAFSSGAVSHRQEGLPTDDGPAARIGGFAGWNLSSDGPAAITRTAARGTVSVAVNNVPARVGGHSGENYGGEITDSYAHGGVSSSSDASQDVGGLVGWTSGGAVIDSYSIGLVSTGGAGESLIGGLIGVNQSGEDGPTTEVTGSYWDVDSSGQIPGVLEGYGTGITTAQFQDTAGFLSLAGWNFDETWAPGDTGFWPALFSVDQVIFARPDPKNLELVYGHTPDVSTTGATFGGPAFHVFSPSGDTLDTGPVFQSLAFPDINVGSGFFTLTTTGLTSEAGLAYRVVDLPAPYEITPAPLTITANNQVKTYGNAFTFDGSEFTAAGLLFADSIASVALASDGAEAIAGVGTYAITSGDAVGLGLANYDITYVAGQMEVTPSRLDTLPRPPVLVSTTLPNPEDAILIPVGVAETPTVGPALTSAGMLAAEDVLAQVDQIATVLEIAAQNCAQSDADVGRYLACLSDALDAFADRLDEISTDLPPGMENVAEIVRDARRSIDDSRSRAEQRLAAATSDAERAAIRADAIGEARQAISGASTEIRKAIALVRAEDPELARVQSATITRVVEAVDSVGIELSRAVGL